MGNRAVIALKAQPMIGVYLHWNGSRDQVEEILAYVARYARRPGEDVSYALARLVETACKLAAPEQSTSVGVDLLKNLDCDNGDNGLYWIGDNWEIAGREYVR